MTELLKVKTRILPRKAIPPKKFTRDADFHFLSKSFQIFNEIER